MRAILTSALAFAGFALFGATAQAGAASTASSAVIAQPGGIEILSNVVFPSGGAAFGPGSDRNPSGKATLTIRGQSGGLLSMAVPTSFRVIRSGSMEGLTVMTTTDSNLQISNGGVVLGGPEFADSTLSIKVGSLVTLGAGGAVSPGPYEGLLVVLVQFN